MSVPATSRLNVVDPFWCMMAGSLNGPQAAPSLEPESEPELPSEVASEGGSADSEVSLPSDAVEEPHDSAAATEQGDTSDKVALRSTHCECKRRCPEKFDMDAVETKRTLMQTSLGRKNHLQGVFLEVSRRIKEGDVKKRAGWKLDGQMVCKVFWAYAHNTSKNKVDFMVKAIRAGHTTLPDIAWKQKERVPKPADKKKASEVDAWFLDLYRSLAEPLAVEGYDDPDIPEGPGELHLTDPAHPLWSLGIITAVGTRKAAKRTLPHLLMKDLWGLYEDDMVKLHGTAPSSKETFRKRYLDVWQAVMPLRHQSNHTQRYKAIKRDRNLDVAGQKISEADAHRLRTQAAGEWQATTVGKTTLDGMDQAKFRCPRNLASSKEFEHLFRPQLHMTGAITYG